MKIINQSEFIELTRAYVALSNAHRLDLILPMFHQTASYHSTSVGSHEGRDAIEAMMTDFFEACPDVFWLVPTYRYADNCQVEFDFFMTAHEKGNGLLIERSGVETIRYSVNGFIDSIDVDTRSDNPRSQGRKND